MFGGRIFGRRSRSLLDARAVIMFSRNNMQTVRVCWYQSRDFSWFEGACVDTVETPRALVCDPGTSDKSRLAEPFTVLTY